MSPTQQMLNVKIGSKKEKREKQQKLAEKVIRERGNTCPDAQCFRFITEHYLRKQVLSFPSNETLTSLHVLKEQIEKLKKKGTVLPTTANFTEIDALVAKVGKNLTNYRHYKTNTRKGRQNATIKCL